jgi:hypothetical protein
MRESNGKGKEAGEIELRDMQCSGSFIARCTEKDGNGIRIEIEHKE